MAEIVFEMAPGATLYLICVETTLDLAQAKDFVKADGLRDRLDAMGLEVMDTPAGTKVRPRDRP